MVFNQIFKRALIFCMLYTTPHWSMAASELMEGPSYTTAAHHRSPSSWSLKNIALRCLCLCVGISAAERPLTPDYKILTKQTYPHGLWGEGYPTTYHLLDDPTYRVQPMAIDNVIHGADFRRYVEFSDAFIKTANGNNTHTLELGFGHGHNIASILKEGADIEGSIIEGVELSQDNIKRMKAMLGTYKGKHGYDVKIHEQDVWEFLRLQARLRPRSFDTIGAFHVLHFGLPEDVLGALQNIHTLLKPNGTVVLTLSPISSHLFANYREIAQENPWASFMIYPGFYAQYLEYKNKVGEYTGIVLTSVPGKALGELMKALGFEVLKAGSYADIYVSEVGKVKAQEHSHYEGVLAVKVRDPDPKTLARWTKGAKLNTIEITPTLMDNKRNYSPALQTAYDKKMNAEIARRILELVRKYKKGQ